MGWSRWPTPTYRGAVALAAALGIAVSAFWWGVPVLLSASGLLVVLVVLAHVTIAVSHPRWEVTREVEPHVAEPGERIEVRFTLRPTRASALDVVDWWEDASGGGHSGAFDTSRSELRARYEVVLSRRGRHRLGPTSVRVTDPFGLASRWTQLAGESWVVVLPRRTRLDAPGARFAGNDDREDSALRLRQPGQGDADVLARPYRSGDAVKRLHWKATAHRGTLMVRQEQQLTEPQVRVVVDTRAGDDRELDWPVTAAASVIEHVHGGRSDVRLEVGGRALVVGRDDALRPAMVELAVAEVADEVPHVAGDDALLVLTGRLDAATARRWMDERRQPGYLIAHAASDEEALHALRAGGWAVATFRDRDDVERVWASLGEEAAP